MPATTPCATASGCPTRRTTIVGLPDLSFAFYDQMVVFDHMNKTMTSSWPWPGSTTPSDRPADLKAAYDEACRRVDALVDAAGIARRTICRRPTSTRRGEPHDPLSNRISREAISSRPSSSALEYIRAGDIFQVVLSQRLETEDRVASRSRFIARCAW